MPAKFDSAGIFSPAAGFEGMNGWAIVTDLTLFPPGQGLKSGGNGVASTIQFLTAGKYGQGHSPAVSLIRFRPSICAEDLGSR